MENDSLVSTAMPSSVIVVTRVFTVVKAIGVFVDADTVLDYRSSVTRAAPLDLRARIMDYGPFIR